MPGGNDSNYILTELYPDIGDSTSCYFMRDSPPLINTGDNVEFTVGGSLNLILKYNGEPTITTTLDLCNKLNNFFCNGSTLCPQDLVSRIKYLNKQLSNISLGSIQDSISRISTITGGPKTNIYQNDIEVNSKLSGIIGMSGITHFTLTLPASINGNNVGIGGNDGNSGQLYSIDTSISGNLPILNDETFIMTNSLKYITFINNSGTSISSTNELRNYLNTNYPFGTILKSTLYDNTISLNNSFGNSIGDSNIVSGRMRNILNFILSSPTGILSDDLNTLAAYVLSTSSGVLENDLNTLASLITDLQSGIIENDIQDINSILNGTSSGSSIKERIGVLNEYDGSIQNLIDGFNTQNLNSGLDEIRTIIDNSSGAIISGTGLNFDFIGYDGITSQVFSDSNISYDSNVVTINIGGENYIYTIAGDIENDMELTFTGQSNRILVIKYTGSNIIIEDSNLHSALLSYFQPGSSITPCNLYSKVNNLRNNIDGLESNNANSGLIHLMASVDGSANFTLIGTTESNFSIISYTGTISQTFTSSSFSNSGSNIISVTIGSDIYTYDNTSITTITGYGTIKFISGNKILLIINNTLLDITESTDQNLSNTLVSFLNTYFIGSSLIANNLKEKINNISSTIGGTEFNLKEKVNSILSDININDTSIRSALDSMSNQLVGNASYNEPLIDQVSRMLLVADDSIKSLPDANLFATVDSIADDGNGDGDGTGIKITLSNTQDISGLNCEGEYILSVDVNDNLPTTSSGGEFTLNYNNTYYLVLYNKSSTTLTTQSDYLNYLKSMYSRGNKIGFNVSDNLTSINSMIGGNDSIRDNLAMCNRMVGDNPGSSLYDNISTLNSVLIGSSDGVVFDNITNIMRLVNGGTDTCLVDQIGRPISGGNDSNISSIIGGTSTNIGDQLGDPDPNNGVNTIIMNIGGSDVSIKLALDSVSEKLLGSSNFTNSLNSSTTNIINDIDNSLISLPNGVNYITVTQSASSNGSTVSMNLNDNTQDQNNTYSITISQSISNNNNFSLLNDNKQLTLINRSGSPISNSNELVKYLNSIYPVGSKICSNINDLNTSISTMIGGNSSSIRGKISNFDRKIINSPTGFLNSDFGAARNLIKSTLSLTLESDINSVKDLIKNQSTRTLDSLIGNPTSNNSQSDILTVIAGSSDSSDSSIFELLGDPVTGPSGPSVPRGLSGLIRNGSVVSNDQINLEQFTDYADDFNSFNNATNLTDQISAFLSVLSRGVCVPQSNIGYTSLCDVLNFITNPP